MRIRVAEGPWIAGICEGHRSRCRGGRRSFDKTAQSGLGRQAHEAPGTQHPRLRHGPRGPFEAVHAEDFTRTWKSNSESACITTPPRSNAKASHVQVQIQRKIQIITDTIYGCVKVRLRKADSGFPAEKLEPLSLKGGVKPRR